MVSAVLFNCETKQVTETAFMEKIYKQAVPHTTEENIFS